MDLFHFSHDPSIERFVPHVPVANHMHFPAMDPARITRLSECLQIWRVPDGRRPCGDPQQSCAVVKPGGLAIRKPVEESERFSLVEDASCPDGSSGHEAVSPDKVDVDRRGFRCRMGVWLIVGQHVPVVFPATNTTSLKSASISSTSTG